ncbi:methyltransferase domain-containing protein [Candidatus Parcubacteria bacterium]|nr:MAG: methyltransferase domain-containing protein [Candidatus Parcubacteria bacterium]
MLTINRSPGTKILELGGGSRPQVHPTCLGGSDIHIDARQCHTPDGRNTVDKEHDLTVFPWPVNDNEFDGVISIFCLEHCPYTKTLQFLKESFRACKPGSKVLFIIPNTEKQVQWILNNPNGWDGKDFFTSASEKLFGSQDDSVKEQEVFKGSFHAAYFNPITVNDLFQKAGFESIVIKPYGTRETDMAVEAIKPVNVNTPVAQSQQEQLAGNQKVGEGDNEGQVISPVATPQVTYNGPNVASLTSEQRALLFNSKYFDKYPGSKLGYYWDDPHHDIVFRKVLEHKPESVLELGCGRGYILKRIEDVGINCVGFDISKHVKLTKVSSRVFTHDVLTGFAGIELDKGHDLCFSFRFLEYVPEEHIPSLVKEMERTCKRGLHGITFAGQEDGVDSLRCTLKTREWWQGVLPQGHSVYSIAEMQQGNLDPRYVAGDGRTKVNVGCAWTMFHNGWDNIDIIDVAGFAGGYVYKYKQHDAKTGLPYGTGIVDLIYTSHFLEHISYEEGLTFLRSCRRVIRPDGGMRILVPDAELLNRMYLKPYDQFNGNVLSDFDEINGNCAKATTPAGKMWSLLHENHKCCYDADTLCNMLVDAKWEPKVSQFRTAMFPPIEQILKETVEMSYGFSLFIDAVPAKN